MKFKFSIKKPRIKLSKNFPDAITNYAIALFSPILIFSFLSLLDSSISKMVEPLFFFPAIAISTWRGGYRTGVVSSLESFLIIYYLFSSNFYPVTDAQLSNLLQALLFLGEAVFLSFLVHASKKNVDILDYKRTEKELKMKIQQLESENANARNEIRSRDEFLSIASHELKTPLTSMLLQTQGALHSIRNVSLAHFSIDSLLKMLQSVEVQTKRMSKMINDLLNISIITTGNLNLEYENSSLNSIINEVIDEFAPRLEKENYKLICSQDDSIQGHWDKLRIEQAFSNLLSNAIKYGNHKPIEISTKKKHNYAVITVKDYGIGISKDQQKKIFGLFERGVSPEQYKGLGVGLYITNQIIKAHQGTIEVTSKPEQGSTFTIKLPLKKEV